MDIVKTNDSSNDFTKKNAFAYYCLIVTNNDKYL